MYQTDYQLHLQTKQDKTHLLNSSKSQSTFYSFYYPTTATDTIKASIIITKNTPSTISSTATTVVMRVTIRYKVG